MKLAPTISIMKNGRLARVGFWVVITIVFLYDRRILIEKAGLPHFIECAVVRIGLLMLLAYLNLNYLIPNFFDKKKYFAYGSLLLISIAAYVSIQQAYDIYLYNFVITASIPKTFMGSFMYTFITTCWYLVLTLAFHFSLEWYAQRTVLRQLQAENDLLRMHGPAAVEPPLNGHQHLLKLKTGTSNAEMDVKDILFIQGLKDYSIIYTASGKTVVHGNLKSMERQLPDDEFERVHKSYVVAVNKITRKERSRLWIGSTQIPIGRTFQKALRI